VVAIVFCPEPGSQMIESKPWCSASTP
jgi:hypothetical protein